MGAKGASCAGGLLVQVGRWASCAEGQKGQKVQKVQKVNLNLYSPHLLCTPSPLLKSSRGSVAPTPPLIVLNVTIS